jgi:hypothetical protein
VRASVPLEHGVLLKTMSETSYTSPSSFRSTDAARLLPVVRFQGQLSEANQKGRADQYDRGAFTYSSFKTSMG